MKKRLLLLTTALMVALLLTLSVSAYAGPPENAQGRWRYFPILVDAKEAGCNSFLTTFENGEWTGTFQGDSTEDGKVVIHCTGEASFNAIVTFDAVTVDGKQGGLQISVVGWFPPDATEWTGLWVIINSTAQLKHLHGQGTWSGAGAPDFNDWGYVDYAGNYHFSSK